MAGHFRELLTSALLFHLFTSGHFEDTFSQRNSDVKRLKNELLCSYDKHELPQDGSNLSVNPRIMLSLTALNFDESRSILYLYSYMFVKWKDPKLTWDPNRWSGITYIRVASDDIWIPDLSVIDWSHEDGDNIGLSSTSCRLSSNGEVNCNSPTRYLVHCNPDISRWPYDTQKCTIDITSWAYCAHFINVTAEKPRISTEHLLPMNEWRLEGTATDKGYFSWGPDETFVTITILLRRHSRGYAATVVIPAFVLASMTLLTFLLDPIDPERVIVSIFNVLAHCLYLRYLGFLLPANGDKTPFIVVFFRDSLFLVGAGLVLSVLLHFLLKPSSGPSNRPPDWLNSATRWLLAWRFGQLLLLSRLDPKVSSEICAEDGSTIMGVEVATSNPGPNKTWHLLATFLNRVFFLVFFLVFFVLILRFLL